MVLTFEATRDDVGQAVTRKVRMRIFGPAWRTRTPKGEAGARARVAGPHRPPAPSRSEHQRRPAHRHRHRAQDRRRGVSLGEGPRGVRRGQGADAVVGEGEETQPEGAAQGAGDECGGGRAAVQGRLHGEYGGDGAREGRTAPGEPGAFGLEPRVPLGGGTPGGGLAHPSHPTSTTKTMATATTATTR